ncbi:hypothetical protein DAI22_02g056400 [Oryza sativa Japonica Group]|nr:hypothetical protein DAI22_02g056400 [Oryza sativa Japonica Group]
MFSLIWEWSLLTSEMELQRSEITKMPSFTIAIVLSSVSDLQCELEFLACVTSKKHGVDG